jgi:hypothetical protein
MTEELKLKDQTDSAATVKLEWVESFCQVRYLATAFADQTGETFSAGKPVTNKQKQAVAKYARLLDNFLGVLHEYLMDGMSHWSLPDARKHLANIQSDFNGSDQRNVTESGSGG